jgi:hypothetical protein
VPWNCKEKEEEEEEAAPVLDVAPRLPCGVNGVATPSELAGTNADIACLSRLFAGHAHFDVVFT